MRTNDGKVIIISKCMRARIKPLQNFLCWNKLAKNCTDNQHKIFLLLSQKLKSRLAPDNADKASRTHDLDVGPCAEAFPLACVISSKM